MTSWCYFWHRQPATTMLRLFNLGDLLLTKDEWSILAYLPQRGSQDSVKEWSMEPIENNGTIHFKCICENYPTSPVFWSVLLWKLNIQIDCLLMERGSTTAELHNCMSLISHANGYSSGTHVLVVYCHQQPQTVHGSKAIQLLLVLKPVPLSVVLKPVPLSVVLKCLLFRHTYAHRCNPIPYIVQQHVLSPHRRGGFWVSCRHPRQRGQWRGDIVPDVC